MARKKLLNSKTRKITAKQRRDRKRRIIRYVVFLLVLSIVVSFIYILNQPQFRIDEIQVRGNALLDTQNITTTVKQTIEGSNYVVFPRDLFFAYPKQDIISALQKEFPEISEIEIQVNSFDVLNIALTERVSEYFLQTNTDIYEVDNAGTVFRVTDKDITETSRVFASYMYDEENVILGQQIVGVGSFKEFNAFLDDLAIQGIGINKVRFDGELVTILQTKNEERIIVRPQTNFESVIETLKEVLKYKEFSFISRKGVFNKPVSYINLRHGNKIFYCYKEDECVDNYAF